MTAALREVRLYGRLGREFGRVFHLAVQTPAEAARALCAVLPGFRAAFLGDDGKAGYHVYAGGPRAQLGPDQAQDLVPAAAPIRFVPAVEGAKRGGLGSVILGAALIGLAIWNPLGLFAGEWAAFHFTGAIGQALVLGGVVQMLSPQRRTAPTAENNPSYGMDAGALNNINAGSPVPLAYGRVVVGSVQISGGLATDEFASNTAPNGMPLDPLALPDYMGRHVVDSGAVAGWVQYER